MYVFLSQYGRGDIGNKTRQKLIVGSQIGSENWFNFFFDFPIHVFVLIQQNDSFADLFSIRVVCVL